MSGAGPRPTQYETSPEGGHATFDPEELREYVRTTTDASWLILDRDENVIGIGNVRLAREALADLERAASNLRP